MAEEDAVTMTELLRLEATFVTDPDNFENWMRVSELYFKIGNISKISSSLDKCYKLMKYNPALFWKNLEVNELAVRFWKFWKYGKRDSIRLNISPERKRLLHTILVSLTTLKASKDGALNQRITYLIGYVKESMGALQEALMVYSDLITLQAMDAGVDLTFIILRAALLLICIEGDRNQAIEYLEYLLDEPPVKEGYSKTHIYAFLANLYEMSGDDFIILKERAYNDMYQAYLVDLSVGKKPFSNQKKLDDILKKTPIHQCSEVWEILALQAVDRCEYALSTLLLKQSISKAPNKGKLWHLQAEICHLLGDDSSSATYAERAFLLLPNEPEVRNLLLTVAREKWQDRLRSVGTTAKEFVENKSPEKARIVGAEEENWIERMKKQAADAIKTVAKDMADNIKNKEAAEKAKRKQDRKDKKAGAQAKDAKEPGNKKKERVKIEGPLKPELPEYASEKEMQKDKAFLLDIISGNDTTTHLYDENLRILASIRDKVEREEREFKARRAEAK